MPLLAVAALDGAVWLAEKTRPEVSLYALPLSALVAHLLVGGTPLARDWDATPFVRDARSEQAERATAGVPRDASVQAPYALMPHLAERERICPAPPPDCDTDVVILDAWQRDAYAHDETLIRTAEEPIVRDWLARGDYGLVRVAGRYLVLERGADGRAGPARRYIRGRGDPQAGQRLAACLALAGAHLRAGAVELDLVARGPCPADLALRLGSGPRPRRVDLLFDGLLSPAKLRRGDRLSSTHSLSPEERARAAEDGLRVGLLRSSGARPEHADPVSVTGRDRLRVIGP